jgi:hypothetical protein
MLFSFNAHFLENHLDSTHSEIQITLAEQFLGLMQKRASTTAYQASLPINIAKRHSFWNNSYPFGIAGTSRSTMIDWDETAIFVESTNRGYGKCHLTTRPREEVLYNHSKNFTLTAAIRGGPNGGYRVELDAQIGTTIMNTYNFLDKEVVAIFTLLVVTT